MISKEKIKNIAEKYISEYNEDIFIVDIKISTNNKIQVLIDSINGILIQDCIKISKAIEKDNDRDSEDYELDVSSFGIDKPLKLEKQYHKYIEKQLKIETTEGIKHRAKLISVNENGIKILETKKQKIKGTKRKEEIINEIQIPFTNIKIAKPIITF